MTIKFKVLIGIIGIMYVACTSYCQTISKLKFINEYTIPYNQIFKNTTIGGLSGIDYDNKNDTYYLISDDRSDINPVRFYTSKIRLSEKGIDTVLFSDVHFLLQSNGEKFASFKLHPAQSVDPEDIRFNGKANQLIWVNEGERILKGNEITLTNPSIQIAKIDGSFVSTFPLPKNLVMQSSENGPRRNGTLESIAFDDEYNTLYSSLEEPLYEDGSRADNTKTNSWVRIYQLDTKAKKNTAQYAYLLESVAFPAEPSDGFKVNGVSGMLAVGKKQLLTIERSYSTGRLPCTIKVFLVDLSQADNIMEVQSLKEKPSVHPVVKKLLLNMDNLGIYIDNVEGVTFGPTLSNGHQTLIFITDNNFQQKEKTQLLLFEIVP